MSNTHVKVDLTRFNKVIRNLATVVPDIKKMVKNEARLMVEEAVKQTVPKELNKSKRQIKATIRRAYAPSKPFGASAIPIREMYKIRKIKRVDEKDKILIQPMVLNEFIRETKNHLGYLAAAWLAGGNPLRAKAKAFVTRHVPKGRTIIIDNPGQYKFTVTNLVVYAPRIKNFSAILQRIVDTRTRKLLANVALIKQGIKKYQSK